MSIMRNQINRLLQEIKYGDKSQMKELLDLTYNHLKYIALHYIFDKRYYEDVLSEAYYKVLNSIQYFNIFKDGYNWLCKIVQNVAKDINKENNQYVLYEEIEKDAFDFDSEVEKMLSNDAFYQLIKNFSKQDRQLIYLKFVLDLSYGKIAQKLNCAKSTVYNRIERIKEIIEKTMKNN